MMATACARDFHFGGLTELYCFGATGCAGDCAFADVACPGLPADPPCSGAGLCLSASGACACWMGYDGADCSLCAEGYIRCGCPIL